MRESEIFGLKMTRVTRFDAVAGADRISELCEERGLSPERLAKAICARAESQDDWWTELGGIDGSTVRRALGNQKNPPRVPDVRVRAAIAKYFGLKPRDIWPPVAATRPTERIAA